MLEIKLTDCTGRPIAPGNVVSIHKYIPSHAGYLLDDMYVIDEVRYGPNNTTLEISSITCDCQMRIRYGHTKDIRITKIAERRSLL